MSGLETTEDFKLEQSEEDSWNLWHIKKRGAGEKPHSLYLMIL